MGTWGYHAFQNDDAADWACALGEEGYAPIEEAFDAVLEKDGTLEIAECQSAIAAAETLGAVLKRPGEAVPTEVMGWAEQQSVPPTPELIVKARRALDHILSESELKEEWTESPNCEAWQKAVAGIITRLG